MDNYTSLWEVDEETLAQSLTLPSQEEAISHLSNTLDQLEEATSQTPVTTTEPTTETDNLDNHEEPPVAPEVLDPLPAVTTPPVVVPWLTYWEEDIYR